MRFACPARDAARPRSLRLSRVVEPRCAADAGPAKNPGSGRSRITAAPLARAQPIGPHRTGNPHTEREASGDKTAKIMRVKLTETGRECSMNPHGGTYVPGLYGYRSKALI